MTPPPLRRPRAVLFDLFHTLVSVRPSADTGGHTWHDLGVSHEAWETVLFADRPGRAVGRTRDAFEGMRLLAHEIDPSIPLHRIERAARRRIQRFDRTLADPEPSVTDAVRRLRAAGARTALVSNACFDEIGAWPRSPLAPLFDATVFSCEIGRIKPDREIYETALARIGVAAADAVFVGDGGSDEHRGAREAGLRTVLVTRLAALPPERLAARRAHADHEFEDVETFATTCWRTDDDRALPRRGGGPGPGRRTRRGPRSDRRAGVPRARRGVRPGGRRPRRGAVAARGRARRRPRPPPPRRLQADRPRQARERVPRAGRRPRRVPADLGSGGRAEPRLPRHGLPISLLDLGAALAGTTGLVLRPGAADERFVFNAAGHAIDVEGLLCVAREGGAPIANPVKDSMESKLHPASRDLLAVVYGSRKVAPPARMREVAERLAALLARETGGSAEVSVLPAA